MKIRQGHDYANDRQRSISHHYIDYGKKQAKRVEYLYPQNLHNVLYIMQVVINIFGILSYFQLTKA